MATGLKFRILGEEEMYKLCSVNKGSDQLICAFVFASDKRRFSYDADKKIMLGQASCVILHYQPVSHATCIVVETRVDMREYTTQKNFCIT